MLNRMETVNRNRFVLRPSPNLPHHIDVEQNRGKLLCLHLSLHIDVEHDRGKRLCFGAFSRST